MLADPPFTTFFIFSFKSMENISASKTCPQDKEVEHMSPHCASQESISDEVDEDAKDEAEVDEKEQIPPDSSSIVDGTCDNTRVF